MCNVCGKTSRWQSSMINHMRIIHSIHPESRRHKGPFKCHLCQRIFYQQSKFNAHMNSHLGIRKYECEMCGKKVNSNSAMAEHMRSHTGEKPFTCDVCNLCFTTKSNKTLHMRRFHDSVGRLKYEEEKRRSLKQPSPVEGGEEIVKSARRKIIESSGKVVQSALKKAWGSLEDLNLPDRVKPSKKSTDTAVGKYACEYCGKRLKSQGHLDDHVRSHTGEKPYACDLCGRCFTTKSNMRWHRKKHSQKGGRFGRCIGQYSMTSRQYGRFPQTRPGQRGVGSSSFTKAYRDLRETSPDGNVQGENVSDLNQDDILQSNITQDDGHVEGGNDHTPQGGTTDAYPDCEDTNESCKSGESNATEDYTDANRSSPNANSSGTEDENSRG